MQNVAQPTYPPDFGNALRNRMKQAEMGHKALSDTKYPVLTIFPFDAALPVGGKRKTESTQP